MTILKDQMLALVRDSAVRKVTQFSSELIHAEGTELEAIQAGIDFERGLAEVCQECLDKPFGC